MCKPSHQAAAVSSVYFIGFVGGLFLLPFPNLLGRKGSLKYIMSIYAVASALSIYGPNLFIKTIGMFIQGFLHIKNTLSFTHILEMVPEKKKELCTTVINIFDAAVLMNMGGLILMGFKDMQGLIEFVNYIGTIIIIIYLICAPESPYYFIINDRRKEGIATLNYIAWFNGSPNRIPEST